MALPKPKLTTVNDVQKLYGVDYSRDYATKQAEAAAKAKRTGLQNQLNQVQTGTKNAQDSLDRTYFQKGLQSAQAQVNGGVNAGLSNESNLRLGMNRQAEMTQMLREAQTSKNNINQQMTDVEAQKLAQTEQIYQDRMQQAIAQSQWKSEFDQSKYGDQRNFDYQVGRDKVADLQRDKQFDYQQGRDKVTDSQWKDQFTYQKGRDKVGDKQWDSQFTYQKGRDKISDKQWDSQFAFQKSQFKTEQEWRKYAFSHMSKSEKAALEWSKKQYGEDAAWRLYEMEYQGNKALSQNQATINGYSAMDFLP
ncbi:hypothetical protein [Peribacillus simplex]|uniref:hypothetical protein n=1 Tax=Peribacillus simplex TaxID=1478 RepID=UPI003D2A61AF